MLRFREMRDSPWVKNYKGAIERLDMEEINRISIMVEHQVEEWGSSDEEDDGGCHLERELEWTDGKVTTPDGEAERKLGARLSQFVHERPRADPPPPASPLPVSPWTQPSVREAQRLSVMKYVAPSSPSLLSFGRDDSAYKAPPAVDWLKPTEKIPAPALRYETSPDRERRLFAEARVAKINAAIANL